MKRTPLKRKTLLKQKTPLRAKKPINWISKKNRIKEDYWHQLVKFLIEHRAHFACEIRYKGCLGNKLLGGHHIIKRSQGGKHEIDNVLIGCPNCHRHKIWHTGTYLSIEGQLKLAKELNEKYNIYDYDLTF